VAVFDGRGREWLGKVRTARDGQVTLALLEPIEPALESRVPFTLIQAVLKGAAMDAVVRDATMMGAAAIQPVLTAHTAVKLALATRAGNAARWRRVAVASAKQCRRATLPEVRDPTPVAAALAAHPAHQVLFLVEPSAERSAQSLRDLVGTAPPDHAALVVGPEGGWAPEEIDLALGLGAALVTLGHLTLRAEAVPLAAMAVFRILWE
jgi:16S rRNA (uracil1498-N3)-methyltransferase